MKKLLILLIIFISFNNQLFADSPLTSIEISRAYLNVPIVIKASKAKGELTVELMKYLKNKNNPIAVKIAIINELSLNAIGRFSDNDPDMDDFVSEVHRKKNSVLFSNYIHKIEKYETLDRFLYSSDIDVLLCMAYLSAMDGDTFFITMPYLSTVKRRKSKSYTTQIICALIEAQQAMDEDWCKVYTLTNNVRTNKELHMNMNQKAINIIFEYMDLYKKDCKTKKPQKNDMNEYENSVDIIINQIIELKSKHKQLESIEGLSKTEKEITTEKFWIGFHFEKGKNTIPLGGKKKANQITSFEEDGIAIHIYFFKSDWTGAAEVNPIPFGDLSSVIFIENDKNGLYQDIEKIIIAEREKLKLKDSQQKDNTEDYKKAIELAENLMVEKNRKLNEYNLVRLQNKRLYGRVRGSKTSVWEIIYKVKRSAIRQRISDDELESEDEYMFKGGEIFMEVDIKTQTAKITGWGE